MNIFHHLCLFLWGHWGTSEAPRWPGRNKLLWSAGLLRTAPSGCYADGPVGLATSQPGSRSTLWFSRCSYREREHGTAGMDEQRARDSGVGGMWCQRTAHFQPKFNTKKMCCTFTTNLTVQFYWKHENISLLLVCCSITFREVHHWCTVQTLTHHLLTTSLTILFTQQNNSDTKV